MRSHSAITPLRTGEISVLIMSHLLEFFEQKCFNILTFCSRVLNPVQHRGHNQLFGHATLKVLTKLGCCFMPTIAITPKCQSVSLSTKSGMFLCKLTQTVVSNSHSCFLSSKPVYLPLLENTSPGIDICTSCTNNNSEMQHVLLVPNKNRFYVGRIGFYLEHFYNVIKKQIYLR